MADSRDTSDVPFAQLNFVRIPRTVENWRRRLPSTFGSYIPQRKTQRRTLIGFTECNRVDNLETLSALLDMTKEAEELASDVEKSERLRLLVVEIRSEAKEEYKRLRRDHQIETQYALCLIEILDELDFGRVSWQNVMGLETRLGRIREDIERTMKEIKAHRLVM